jgi:iron complex transport system permease protein
MLIGAIYMVIVDTIARTALVTEIPIGRGILTTIIGAPVFAYLLRRNRRGRQKPDPENF